MIYLKIYLVGVFLIALFISFLLPYKGEGIEDPSKVNENIKICDRRLRLILAWPVMMWVELIRNVV